MTEQEARSRCADLVSHETMQKIERYVALLIDENQRQNLISSDSIALIWCRHILDAAQLNPLISGRCVDIGSGAGLPGAVLALANNDVLLVEPRKRRAAFLQNMLDELSPASARVFDRNVERLTGSFETITARAVAPLHQLFALASHLATPATRWVLPKGRSAHSELEVARAAWHGRFSTIPSITDPSALIVVAEDVSRKAS